MKALFVQMMDLYLIFQFFKVHCYGNQIMLRKCYQCRLIPLAFIALVVENEMQHHGLAVCINSGDNGAISSKTLVNFCLVTPEMTGLICIPMYWAKIDLIPAFVVLPCRNATEYFYADGCINSSNDQATFDINVVGF